MSKTHRYTLTKHIVLNVSPVFSPSQSGNIVSIFCSHQLLTEYVCDQWRSQGGVLGVKTLPNLLSDFNNNH